MIKKYEEEKIKIFSQNVKKNIVQMSLEAGAASSHLGGALSSVDIISVLYSSIMNFDKKNYNKDKRDRFILSKGHACLVLYSALAEKGVISKKELKSFEKNNSNLPGHPVINRKIGIEFSNGSLGLGLSLGIGVALSLKKKKIDSNVYILIGDGECNEGSVWEAAMLASSLKIDNITAIIDNNGFQQTGKNDEILKVGKLNSKWKSFGWETYSIDGHNLSEIHKTLKLKSERPKAIIAKTIKGKGFSFSENNNDWHHKIMTKKIFKKAISEINKE